MGARCGPAGRPAPTKSSQAVEERGCGLCGIETLVWTEAHGVTVCDLPACICARALVGSYEHSVRHEAALASPGTGCAGFPRQMRNRRRSTCSKDGHSAHAPSSLHLFQFTPAKVLALCRGSSEGWPGFGDESFFFFKPSSTSWLERSASGQKMSSESPPPTRWWRHPQFRMRHGTRNL